LRDVEARSIATETAPEPEYLRGRPIMGKVVAPEPTERGTQVYRFAPVAQPYGAVALGVRGDEEEDEEEKGEGKPRKKKPCWKGYEMVGMKTKAGKEVPNCVPMKGKGNGPRLSFKSVGLTGEEYLKRARAKAKEAGYDPSLLHLCTTGKNKLEYRHPDFGTIHFGAKGYGDFILWSELEKQGKVEKGFADMKRNVFQKSHGAMSKKYKLGKHTANQLALKILW
jgi:hypothetical protein